jgi:hypothetical protein
MILRMIATGSLSAFSTSVLPALPSQARGAVQQARATQAQSQPQPAPQVQLDQGKGTAQPAGRLAPRGSLLDLSV